MNEVLNPEIDVTKDLNTIKSNLAALNIQTQAAQDLANLEETIPGKDGIYYRNDNGTIRTVVFQKGKWIENKVPPKGVTIYGPNGTFENARLRGTQTSQPAKTEEKEQTTSELDAYTKKQRASSEIVRIRTPDPEHPGQTILTPQIQVIGLQAPEVDPIDIASGAFFGGMMLSGIKTAGRFVLSKGIPEVTLGQAIPQVAKAGVTEVGQQIATSSIINAISP